MLAILQNGREMVSTWTEKPPVRAGVDRKAPLSIRLRFKQRSTRHGGLKSSRNALDSDTALVRLIIRKNPVLLGSPDNEPQARPASDTAGGGGRQRSPLVGPTKRATHVEQAAEVFADGGSIPPASTIVPTRRNSK